MIELIIQSLAFFIYPFNLNIINGRGYCWTFFSGMMAGFIICLLILAYVVFFKIGVTGISEISAHLYVNGLITFAIFPAGIGFLFIFLKWLGVQLKDQKDWY